MKRIVDEWASKAEGDWEVAQKTYRARKNPVYDASCFHCQQCAEKYLKAKLVEVGIAFTKTHNLLSLLNLALPIEPGWLTLHPHLNSLDKYSVLYRYPGNVATKADAREAIKHCSEARKTIRRSLGLPI